MKTVVKTWRQIAAVLLIALSCVLSFAGWRFAVRSVAECSCPHEQQIKEMQLHIERLEARPMFDARDPRQARSKVR